MNYPGIRPYLLRSSAAIARATRHFSNSIITYDNEIATDGIGAQLQRIYGCYALARHLGALYLHTPLARIDNKGIVPGKDASSVEERANALFNLPSDEAVDELLSRAKIVQVSEFRADRLWRSAGTERSPALFRVKLPYPHLEVQPSAWSSIPFLPRPRVAGSPTQIAVHVRRGDVGKSLADRYLPLSYFQTVTRRLTKDLDQANLSYRINVYTETDEDGEPVSADGFGAGSANIFADTDPVDTLASLVNADILIASKSSFSYVAAIMNPNRPIFLPKSFWHTPLQGWTVVDDLAGAEDVRNG